MNYLDLDSRETARYMSLARFGVGVAMLVLPRRMARNWLGDGEWQGTPVAMRAIGARDIAISVGTMTALENGGDTGAWLRAGATADAADAAALVLAFRNLRGLRKWVWPLIAGGSAYLSLELAEDLDA